MRPLFALIGRWMCALSIGAALLLAIGTAYAADPAVAMPNSEWWLAAAITGIEAEVVADFNTAPAIPGALSREWRSLDRKGSASGAAVDLGWMIGLALVALAAEKAVARGLSRRARRAMRIREGGGSLSSLLWLLFCDIIGLGMFLAVFGAVRQHWLAATGVGVGLAILSANVLVRWRVTMLVVRLLLRPGEPAARLIEVSDAEARRLARFLSAMFLAMIVVVGMGRYELMDEDSGAAHVLGLINAVIVCGLFILTAFQARIAAEALIRGRAHAGTGVVAAIRGSLARAWIGLALGVVAALAMFFVAGLSLGLLSYYRAMTSTLGIVFVLLVLDRLFERAWHGAGAAATNSAPSYVGTLVAQTLRRLLRAGVLLAAAIVLVWVWVDAAHLATTADHRALRAFDSALVTLFIADAIWQLVRLAIESHLAPAAGAAMSSDPEEGEAMRATRLQTALPFLRAALAVVIAILAMLVILSRLGVDTAPLIAGAGVFGLAISFGSQSLVRDIISGLFYMWDDAFRVGEYIDTGRLRGTVEAMSIRSVKLRHHNGPLHTIPYGQLGAVSNMSRDWVILKFNLRLERGTDIELVRKTVKQIGIQMQTEPDAAAEVLQPLKLQGIVEFADTALVVRLKFTARPIKPSWIQREYLKRIYRGFGERGIAFASGTLTLQTVSPLEASIPILAGPALAGALPAPAD